MNFQLEEILTVIDRVKEADLALFEYQDADARIKIQGKQETGGIPAEEWTQGSRNGKISEEEGKMIAKELLEILKRDWNNPQIRADYEKWLKNKYKNL